MVSIGFVIQARLIKPKTSLYWPSRKKYKQFLKRRKLANILKNICPNQKHKSYQRILLQHSFKPKKIINKKLNAVFAIMIKFWSFIVNIKQTEITERWIKYLRSATCVQYINGR